MSTFVYQSSVSPKPGGNLLTSGKLLQLLVSKSVKLSLACVHTLVVIQSGSFAGKGKVWALKLLTGNKKHQNTFFKLGQE